MLGVEVIKDFLHTSEVCIIHPLVVFRTVSLPSDKVLSYGLTMSLPSDIFENDSFNFVAIIVI